jgi:hypothetical protein
MRRFCPKRVQHVMGNASVVVSDNVQLAAWPVERLARIIRCIVVDMFVNM